MAAFEHGFGAGTVWAWLVMALLWLNCSSGLDIVQIDDGTDANMTLIGGTAPDSVVAANIATALQSTDEQDRQALMAMSQPDLVVLHMDTSKKLDEVRRDLVRAEAARDKENAERKRMQANWWGTDAEKRQLMDQYAKDKAASDKKILDLELNRNYLTSHLEELRSRLNAYQLGAGDIVEAKLEVEKAALQEKLQLINELNAAYENLLQMKQQHGAKVAATDAEVHQLLDMVQELHKSNLALTKQILFRQKRSGMSPAAMPPDVVLTDDGGKRATSKDTTSSQPATGGLTDSRPPEELFILGNCTTVQCGVGRLSELSFSFMWTVMTDPLSFTVGIWQRTKLFIEDHFAVLSIIVGGLISFIGSNFIIHFFRKFQSVCAGIVAFFVFLRNLPTIDLLISIWKGTLGRLVQVSKETKEEREKREKREKEAKEEREKREKEARTITELKEEVLKLTTTLDVIDKGAEKTRKKTMEELGQFRRQMEEKLERQPFAGPSGYGDAGAGPRLIPYQPAGRGGGRGSGQKKDNRWQWRNQNPGQGSQGPQVQQVQAVPQDQGGASGPPPATGASSSSANQEAKVNKVQASADDNMQLLYTPAMANGVRLSRCLVDTGSEVSLLPKSVAVKYGFTVNKAGISALLDFHGGSSAVDGSAALDLQIGPTTMQGCEFLVSPAISVPIIGLPALQALGIRVDCAEGELVEKTTGATVKCSVVQKQKN